MTKTELWHTQNKRVELLHHEEHRGDQEGDYVLYWMQQSQRVSYNHALNYAIERANDHRCPLVVFFGMTDNYPEASHRHYQFMLEGLVEVQRELSMRGIRFVFEHESPEIGIQKWLNKAIEVIFDKSYLRLPRQWRQQVLEAAKRMNILNIYEIDANCVVPVTIASDKVEYGARTIRPKLHRLLSTYNDVPVLPELIVKVQGEEPITLQKIEKSYFKGGRKTALTLWKAFVEGHLSQYHLSQSPADGHHSKLSPYLHFGQISSLELIHLIEKAYREDERIPREAVDGFIEQIFVRRELAYNFTTYCEGYDRFETMTEPWAYKTMDVHQRDIRPYLYSYAQLEQGETHDPYWNAAVREMVQTGHMQNYMRMYWCKKIVEWTKDYETAYYTAIELNNRYLYDGRDPNGYAGVAWCFGRHDRAWTERPIFGKLRYMNDKGLVRKFDMGLYLEYTRML
jgi:deoxyribodipyrimidine photo-lyase